jgi:TPR repeat protein
LAHCYDTGYAVPRDTSKALFHLQLSASRYVVLAVCNLAVWYRNGNGVEADRVLAAAYYLLSQSLGFTHATTSIEMMQLDNDQLISAKTHFESLDQLKRVPQTLFESLPQPIAEEVVLEYSWVC